MPPHRKVWISDLLRSFLAQSGSNHDRITLFGFSPHKSAFRDALALRYGWQPLNVPTTCACGKGFTIDHMLSCARGGFLSIRHNEISDVTATFLSEVCHDVCTEPHLQPLDGEAFSLRSANANDVAKLDIVASGFWGGRFESLKEPTALPCS